MADHVIEREDLVKKATQLNEFIVSHVPSMVQRAGEIAIKHGEDGIKMMVETLQEKVAFCFEALSSVKSISVPKPVGTIIQIFISTLDNMENIKSFRSGSPSIFPVAS